VNVLLGISGGISAYKTPDLVRHLRRAGHAVRCVLTANAAHLVAPAALAAVSGYPVAQDLWAERGEIGHIELARWAQVLLVAPATADLLAKFALGLADDLLSTIHLARDAGVGLLLAPAMNTRMWVQPAVQANLATLVARGARVIGPVAGGLACGEEGIGAMAPLDDLVGAIAG
jgi:phosphopantothenoylcysteine decarboxylase/phosphopantothenate--cysteine ligase